MRRLNQYIYQQKNWTNFVWQNEVLLSKLSEVRNKQGVLLGKMVSLGFPLRSTAFLNTLTLDVLKSTEIEGEFLDAEQVRSSVARRLGMEIAGLIPADRNVDGVVEMLLDATQNYKKTLSKIKNPRMSPVIGLRLEVLAITTLPKARAGIIFSMATRRDSVQGKIAAIRAAG